MNSTRIALLIAAAFCLSACTDQDWNHALSFVGVKGGQNAAAPAQAARPAQQPTAAAARPAPAPAQTADAAPKPNEFCLGVATQDSQANDFDPATQQRVLVQSYRQCVAIFGDTTK